VTSFTDTTVAEGSSYRYVVLATNAAGDSAITNIIPVTTPLSVPLAPTNPMAFVAEPDHVELVWSTNAFNEEGYRIERAVDGGEYVVIATLSAITESFGDSGLSENTTYSYRIVAFNSAGESSAQIEVLTPATIPTAPSDVLALANTPTKITITWTDNSFNETEFTVQRSLDGTNWSTVGFASAGSIGYLDEGLTPGTTYFYRVASTNTAGSSEFSTVASATTSNVAPAAPSDLTIVGVDYKQVVLSWTDNATNELAFRIERSTAGGAFTTIATVGADVTSYVDSGLASSTSYTYRVVAYNSVGASAYSNTATGQTLTDVAGPTATLAASNITTGGGTTYRFTVTYSDLVAVNTGSIDKNDILVTGPHGFRQRATLLSVTILADGSAVATYSITAPKGDLEHQGQRLLQDHPPVQPDHRCRRQCRPRTHARLLQRQHLLHRRHVHRVFLNHDHRRIARQPRPGAVILLS
jgi:fibronectin type 3 domain-containing protein